MFSVQMTWKEVCVNLCWHMLQVFYGSLTEYNLHRNKHKPRLTLRRPGQLAPKYEALFFWWPIRKIEWRRFNFLIGQHKYKASYFGARCPGLRRVSRDTNTSRIELFASLKIESPSWSLLVPLLVREIIKSSKTSWVEPGWAKICLGWHFLLSLWWSQLSEL